LGTEAVGTASALNILLYISRGLGMDFVLEIEVQTLHNSLFLSEKKEIKNYK
jgi:hypothetical protein